jgi:hypothetical protein
LGHLPIPVLYDRHVGWCRLAQNRTVLLPLRQFLLEIYRELGGHWWRGFALFGSNALVNDPAVG